MSFHVDDYQIRWKNFRAFKDTDWITIRPLTLLIGPNNSGKTSVFAPLLLMSQTVRSPDATTPLVTRGPLIDAGAPQNVIHNGNTAQPLYFGFKFHLHKPSRKMKPVGEYPPGVLELTFDADKRTKELKLRQFKLLDVYQRHLLTKSHRSKDRYAFRSDSVGRMKVSERRAVELAPSINFLFSPTTTLNLHRTQASERLQTAFSKGFQRYLGCLSFAFGDVTTILRSLTYVGPLRERPERYYEISGETPQSVGASGEQMANMIRRHRSEIQRSLDKWIERFEFGKHLRVEGSRNGMLFSLLFESGNGRIALRNIADSGFGVSQALPLIVQALTAEKETLTIAEQPEIHLNPKLQCVLADLFVEMANTDHRVIVETHSEHLLLRLRRLIASGQIAQDKVAIYYVERGDTGSTIRSIPVKGDGSIEHQVWPKGFFGETLRESLALAEDQARARKQPKSKRS